MCLVFSFSIAIPAFAQEYMGEAQLSAAIADNQINPMDPMDGFSWGYSASDPSANHSYGPYSHTSSGNVKFESALASLLVSEIQVALISLLPISAVAQKAATLIFNFANAYSSTSTHVYYKLYTATNTQLPGFYQKLRYDWYEDGTYKNFIGSTYIYRFKA